MQHITVISRQQMRFSSLEDTISSDNQVRFIDTFVESIDLSKLGFAVKTLKIEGRPSFNSKVFLMIYLYRYLNGVRSGRDLEKQCFITMELRWLLEDIRPNYHGISDFRKQNPAGVRKQQTLSKKSATLPQATGNQQLVPNLIREAHFWHHQAAMGLQPHQLNGIGKNKWRIQFDYDGL